MPRREKKMAEVRPFRAIRPRKGLEERIAALPYDVYSEEEARRETEREPLSFLTIDRAETQFPAGTDPESARVYEKAGSLLWERMEDGIFVQEKEPSYYIYELEMDGRVQTGVVGCVSVNDCLNHVVKKHENTRREKEEDRVRHVDACDAQTGPIFLAYRSRTEIDAIVERCKRKDSLYDFRSLDGIAHRAWRIDGEEEIGKLQEAFAKVESLYIADGHHRCASAIRVALQRRKEKPEGGEFDSILSVLFPDDQLMIMEYNRVVKDLNGLSEEEFLSRIGESFLVEKVDGPYRPERKGTFGLYLTDAWYRLERKLPVESDPVAGLDVSVLQERILGPILGIRDPRTDGRIDFVGGIRGLSELERRCRQDCRAAFCLYPTSIEELFAVADVGCLMPPKSTWFEPKLRSGLFIHSLKEGKEEQQ